MAESTFVPSSLGSNNSNLQDVENTSTEFSDGFENCSEFNLPPELTEISDSSFVCIVAYCVVFVVATTGHVIVLHSLLKKHQNNKSRITLLLLHLSLADLIVCWTLIPTEVFWRLTIQWLGGNILCKLTQFLRAFGLYLSSSVLILVSFDRFLSIVFPLTVLKSGAYQRIKVKLYVAWIAAALFSVPQAIFFSVETHPEFPSFKQCVTNDFLNNSRDVKIYSIFSVAVMYFVPLLVILCTYTAIIIKLVRKSNKTSGGSQWKILSCIFYSGCFISRDQFPDVTRSSNTVQLRCTGNADANMSKAKKRTFLMTVVIVISFIVCWTPYAAMTLWYMVDWEGAEKVDPVLQEALFLMAVVNSCINPLIYGGFTYKRGKRRRASRARGPQILAIKSIL